MVETYKVSDIWLAVVLYDKGYVLEDIEIDEQGRGLFCFEKTEDLTKCVADYWQKALAVEPMHMFQSYKVVRSQLESAKKNPTSSNTWRA